MISILLFLLFVDIIQAAKSAGPTLFNFASQLYPTETKKSTPRYNQDVSTYIHIHIQYIPTHITLILTSLVYNRNIL